MREAMENFLNERMDKASTELYKDPRFKEKKDKERIQLEKIRKLDIVDIKNILGEFNRANSEAAALEGEILYKSGFYDGIRFCEIVHEKLKE